MPQQSIRRHRCLPSLPASETEVLEILETKKGFLIQHQSWRLNQLEKEQLTWKHCWGNTLLGIFAQAGSVHPSKRLGNISEASIRGLRPGQSQHVLFPGCQGSKPRIQLGFLRVCLSPSQPFSFCKLHVLVCTIARRLGALRCSLGALLFPLLQKRFQPRLRRDLAANPWRRVGVSDRRLPCC